MAEIAPDDVHAVVGRRHERGPFHPSVADIRRAVRIAQWQTPAQEPDVDNLARRAREAWELWHTSSTARAEVGALLPDLIADTHIAVRALEGSARRRAYAVMAQVYHLAQQHGAHACEPELYWTHQDRGMMAAQEADDPIALAPAAYWASCAYRSTDFNDDALAVVDEVMALLRPRLSDADPDTRALYGALHLNQAVTYAKLAREADAWRHWDAADDIAERLPDGYVHFWSAFGRGNVALHGVTLAADLTRGHAAVSRAEGIDPTDVPSVERRARLWVDLSRGYVQQGDRVAALAAMEEAVECSAEAVAYTPRAREVVTELLRAPSAPMARRVERLAVGAGMLPA